jgi:hypothetical protein
MEKRKDPSNLLPIMDKIRAEELLARFRSKDDLYRYMTNQRKEYL